MHHFKQAKEKQEDQIAASTSPKPIDYEGIANGLKYQSSKELGSRFRRVSPDLFLKLFSLCDAPSLVRSIGVSKAWKDSILGSSELFRSFEMEGTGEQVCQGLELFNRRNQDSTKHVILKVEDELDPALQERLGNAIKRSSKSLKTISVVHQGDLDKSLAKVAGQCHSLSVLRSFKWGLEGILLEPLGETIEFSSSWGASLMTLEWGSGETNLVCNEALLERLRDAKNVIIISKKLSPSWVVKLFSLNPSLVEVEFGWTQETNDEIVDDIPKMNLPNLVKLNLISPPKSTSGNSSIFCKQLMTPSLNLLQFLSLNPKDLSSMKVDSAPKQLGLLNLQITDPASAKSAASTLIHSIQDWEELWHISLILPKTTPSTFYEHLFQLLSPLSGPNIQAGWRDKMLLPNLRSLYLSATGSEEEPSLSVDGLVVASMVASRKACSKGFSLMEVVSAASGLLGFSDAASSSEPAFETHQSCTHIQSMVFELPVRANDLVRSWLKKEKTVHVEEWVSSG